MQSNLSLEFGPLVRAVFLERPNRFLAICQLECSSETVEAHVADPGRLKELLVPGAVVYLRSSDNPTRRTKWSVILVEAPGAVLVSLQSALVNQLTDMALRNKAVAELEDWELVNREYTVGKSRFDFLLRKSRGKQMLLEVKSCTLVQDGMAMFPDAVTTRGRRHLQELTHLQASGAYGGTVLFVVQRSDARAFKPAEHIDPQFAEALRQAHQGGLGVLVYDCKVDVHGIAWGQRLPVDL